MGTRADFYVRDNSSDKAIYWLGSIGWDGYPEGIDKKILKAIDLETFKTVVGNFLSREDATCNKDGWPWHWEDSNTTDYAYVFDMTEKQVFISAFGCPFFTLKEECKYNAIERHYYKRLHEDEDFDKPAPDFDKYLEKIGCKEKFVFPNMKNIQNVKLDGPGSGLIVIYKEKI